VTTAIDRRRFLTRLAKLGLITLGTAGIPGLTPGRARGQAPPRPTLAVTEGTDPAALVRETLGKLGGIGKFVRSGDRVVVKPNIGWDRTPEEAANTNPVVVAEICRLARAAGAESVRVFDRTCNDARRCYERSGIRAAVEALDDRSIRIEHVREEQFEVVDIRGAKSLDRWPLYRPALDANVLINVPIVKHHGLSEVTIAMKNLMGIMGGNRGRIHQGIDENLVDLNSAVRSHLTVVDATRILLRNGPQGGGTQGVKIANRLAATTDVVAADAWGAREFGVDPMKIGYIRKAHEQGLGIADLGQAVVL